MHAASFLLLTWLHSTPGQAPPSHEDCADLHIELARDPARTPREVCISAGRLTGFVFDVPIDSAEVQDAVRFVEVNRGRRMLGLMPPPDLQPGERLRLTVELAGGPPQSITFMLVAQSGRATHQVQVFRDPRPVESLRQETEVERAKRRELQAENEQLRIRLARSQGLGMLLATKSIGRKGVRVLPLSKEGPVESTGDLSLFEGRAFRIETSVTAEVSLLNKGASPWSATGAALMNERGEALPGLQLFQNKPIEPALRGSVVVELPALDSDARGHLTLRLWDDAGRAIAITPVVFPTLPDEPPPAPPGRPTPGT